MNKGMQYPDKNRKVIQRYLIELLKIVSKKITTQYFVSFHSLQDNQY